MCERCGFTNKDHRLAYNEELHGHHIEEVDDFDNPDDAHTIDNIEILCKQCHLLEHTGSLFHL